MGFNRIDVKLQAKASMRGTYPHPMLVTLVFLLSTTVLTMVIQGFTANPLSSMYHYLAQGYDAQEVMEYVFKGGRMTLFFFLSVLLSLYTMIMTFGYTSYSLRMARNEQPAYRNLLDGFAMAGRVILMGFLVILYVFLWEMLALVPYTLFIILAFFMDSELMVGLAIVVLMAGMVLGAVMSYRYRLATYFLLDNPDMSARKSITQSKLAMRGWKGALFVLDLSFIGWFLLTPLTLGILSLWLTPYRHTSEANFYDAITGGAASRQEPLNPAPEKKSGPDLTF